MYSRGPSHFVGPSPYAGVRKCLFHTYVCPIKSFKTRGLRYVIARSPKDDVAI